MVEGLAPDAASVTAARKLARPAPWSQTGHDERAVWGLCKGSGARPYQAQVEFAGPAYRCSCPSRKVPCKHALGLLLLWAQGEVASAPEPEWVRAWIAERAKRAERPAGAPPRDSEAAARRAEQRAERVAAGAAELREWLVDRIRTGLGGAATGGAEELYGVAARMVDAQAPGLASGLRRAA